MQEVEDGVPLREVLVIAGGRVDENPPPRPDRSGPVPAQTYLSVRNGPQVEIARPLSRNIEQAEGRTRLTLRVDPGVGRIWNRAGAIDDEPIEIPIRFEGIGGHAPDSIPSLVQGNGPSPVELSDQFDPIGTGRMVGEGDTTILLDLRRTVSNPGRPGGPLPRRCRRSFLPPSLRLALSLGRPRDSPPKRRENHCGPETPEPFDMNTDR